ncbi:MAG: Xaa-Pro peptidase family protein [Candidatus Dormibacteria bacterium]
MPDAIVLYGDSLRHPNVRWRTGFNAPDPVLYVEAGDARVLLVGGMELNRARKESKIKDVRQFDTAAWRERMRQGDEFEAHAATVAEILAELGADQARVEPDFPVALAMAMDEQDVVVKVDTQLFRRERRHKTADEQEHIARSQAAAVASMQAARRVLAESEVRDGKVWHQGAPLTSARLRNTIEVELFNQGCSAEDVIVAAGPGAADPHCTDTGHLDANTGIILDIYPTSKSSRYWGDITRTYVVGEPSETWLRMYDAVRSAQARALSLLRAGIDGRDVHRAVCQVLYDAGFGATTEGFQREGVPLMNHGTGHGLGLEIHEPPRVNDFSNELLEGDVVTIEPGLYSPEHGSLRLENTVVITADGYRELTDIDVEWRP